MISFTPSPALNVTLTYPAGVGLSSLPVLSMMSSNAATVTFALTSSVEPSLYFTTTGISTGLPASASVGVYLIFPVFASISAPFGAFAPSSNVVPSGFVVSCPLSSLKLGAVIVVGFPTCASASVYSGCTFSAVFCVSASFQTA